MLLPFTAVEPLVSPAPALSGESCDVGSAYFCLCSPPSTEGGGMVASSSRCSVMMACNSVTSVGGTRS